MPNKYLEKIAARMNGIQTLRNAKDAYEVKKYMEKKKKKKAATIKKKSFNPRIMRKV